VRRRFAEEMLRRPSSSLLAYWQQRIFSGRDVPPPVATTDAEVLDYVNRFEGAIGYVSGTAIPAGTKAVPLR
jgi:hypothetical protein